MPIAQVNGTTLHYEVNGAGDPLLLLPGLGLDKTYYRFGEPLLRESYRTIGVDPRGVGQSDRTLREFTFELWAEDFAALIDALGLGKVHVLGSSLGGCVAQTCPDSRFFLDQVVSCAITEGVAGGCRDISCITDACRSEIAACLADRC